MNAIDQIVHPPYKSNGSLVAIMADIATQKGETSTLCGFEQYLIQSEWSQDEKRNQMEAAAFMRQESAKLHSGWCAFRRAIGKVHTLRLQMCGQFFGSLQRAGGSVGTVALVVTGFCLE